MSGIVPVIAGFVALGLMTIAVLVYIVRSAIKEAEGREARAARREAVEQLAGRGESSELDA